MTKILVLLASFLAAQGVASAEPKEIITPATDIYIPTGFTNSDNAEIILGGEFRNTCYRVGSATADVNAENKTISIKANSTVESNSICGMMMVPFIQPVPLGKLEPGEYQVIVEGNPNLGTETLVIEPRTLASDARIFAHVTDAQVLINEENEQELVIQGTYPLTFVGCAKIQNVQIRKENNEFLVVEPLLALYSDDRNCTNWSVNFSEKIKLNDSNVEVGEPFFIYVRATDTDGFKKITAIEN